MRRAHRVGGLIYSVWVLIRINNRQHWKLQDRNFSPGIDYNTLSRLNADTHILTQTNILTSHTQANIAF